MTNWYFMWNRHEDENARRAYAGLVATLFIDGVKAV